MYLGRHRDKIKLLNVVTKKHNVEQCGVNFLMVAHSVVYVGKDNGICINCVVYVR